jgi:hypothetical protein
MSRSLKIKKPRWTDPDDIAYLSFFGTLLQGLRMAEAKVRPFRFELKRKTVPVSFRLMKPVRQLLAPPASPQVLSDAQTTTLKSIASAAEKVRYEPQAYTNSGDLLTIEMTKVTNDKVPVYVRK